jgi:NAD+ kinase
MTVEAAIGDARPVAGVNDVVVEKAISQRLVSIEVAVDGEPFLTYHADGLVFSTPTGSTAYNLSAGGPLVHPQLDALILTPVAHHSLFSTAVVFPDDSELVCTVVHDRPVSVAVDGRELGRADPGDRITIRRGSRDVRFIDYSGRSYPRLVTEKLKLE